MLLQYGLKNFFGFKEGATVNFKCSKSAAKDNRYVNFICVKGKNASGKTNLLKALSFLSNFCANSFDFYKPDAYIHIEPFFRNDDDSEFFIEFIQGKYQYRYEIELNDERVKRETLYRKSSRTVKIVERMDNKFTYLLSEFNHFESIKLRKNVSFISSLQQYEFDDSSLSDVYYFFRNISCNVGYAGLKPIISSVNNISKTLYNNKDMFDFTKKIIISCDTGIKDIIIKEERHEDTNEVIYRPYFIHDITNSESTSLHHFAESSGTQSLYFQLGMYYTALSTGGVLCLDEFDTNLHSHILPLLLDLFDTEKTNPHNAQLIFTTHNSEILEKAGKYRTYIVDKEQNECYTYRLDEIPSDLIRNDRAILPLYNSGKLGGVPNL